VTILTSLLGSKVFSLMVFMWQEAAAPAGTPAVDHISLMTMIKRLGVVAAAVLVILLIKSVNSNAIMVER
jgi:hypothetical protein